MKRRDLLVLAAGALAPSVGFAQGAKREGRLGLLLLLPRSQDPFIDPLLAALNDRGWSVGRNLRFEARSTAAQQDGAADMARELIAKGVNILVTGGTANAVAARQTSRSVPIVMLASGYPVESGLATSLAKPGGNVTCRSRARTRALLARLGRVLGLRAAGVSANRNGNVPERNAARRGWLEHTIAHLVEPRPTRAGREPCRGGEAAAAGNVPHRRRSAVDARRDREGRGVLRKSPLTSGSRHQ